MGIHIPDASNLCKKNACIHSGSEKVKKYEKNHVMNGDETWRFKIDETIQRYVPTLVS